MMTRTVLIVLFVLLLCLLFLEVAVSWGFNMEYRSWSVIVRGPYVYKGKVQVDIPQFLTWFPTLKECQKVRDAKLAVPGTRLVRDCWDMDLPSADSFPPPWKAQP